MIEQFCRSCEHCETDRPRQPRELAIHPPTPTRAFQYQSADFAEGDGLKSLITVNRDYFALRG